MNDNTKDFLIKAGELLLVFMWLIALITNTITVINADGWINGVFNVCALGMAVPTMVAWIAKPKEK